MHPRHPYTGALLSAVPVPDPRLARNKNRQVLGGDVPSPANPPSACRFHTRCPKFVEGKCDVDYPELSVKEGGNVAACHFPLTDEEISRRVPTAAA
jgi:peptide/nickel transport system ATP-binding protein/oligopeptide transport system ATP-binding protein